MKTDWRAASRTRRSRQAAAAAFPPDGRAHRRTARCSTPPSPSVLHYRGGTGVKVHEQRGEEADGEINRHGDGDHLDSLAGDVEHRAGEDLHQVGIADG